MEDQAVEGLYHLNISINHLYLEDAQVKYNAYVDSYIFLRLTEEKLLAQWVPWTERTHYFHDLQHLQYDQKNADFT